MNLSDFNEVKKLNLLQYGESGSGKSIRAASFAAFGPTFIFDFDNKIGGIFEWFKDKPEILRNIEYETIVDKPGATAGCVRTFAKLKELSKASPFPYTTIIVDSWTAWETLFINQVMLANPSQGRMATYVDTEKRDLIYVPSQLDYRMHAHHESQFITQLCALPCNIIVNGHVSVRQDELTGAIDRGLAAAGKLSKHLPKFFNEVHRCFLQKTIYRVQVRSSDLWPCNTRLKLPATSDGTLDTSVEILRPMAMTKETAR